MKNIEYKYCRYCGEIFFKKDFKKNFHRMITCGSNICKKIHKKEWTFRNKCLDCGVAVAYFAKRCRNCAFVGEKNPFCGKTHTEEAKNKINLFQNGHMPWNKGKKHSKESNEKNRKSHLGKKLTKEHIKKILRRREMSSLEIKMYDIIIENSLPYIFVGNGEFFIERKNPDFININGNKIAIEVYYKRHKELFSQAKNDGIDLWMFRRQAIFNKYGWKIEFFDETQVSEKEVLERLL